MMKMGNLIKKLIFDEYEEVRDKQMEKEAGSEAGKLALFSCLSLKQSVGHNTTIHNIAPGNKKYGRGPHSLLLVTALSHMLLLVTLTLKTFLCFLNSLLYDQNII